MDRSIRFSLYTYQLVPSSVNIQQKIDGEYSTYDELVGMKNKLFEKAITNDNVRFQGKGYNPLVKLMHNDKDLILFRFGVQKNLVIADKEFNEHKTTNHPSVLVYIDNNPERQLIAIENNTDAFTETKTVANIIENTLAKHLANNQLSIYIEQRFHLSEFWETLADYQGRITSLKFNFIKPNMSNISKKAVETIKLIKSKNNSHKTILNLNAPKKGVLENLDPTDQDINSLAEYCALGGGSSSIKVKGLTKRVKTTKNEVTKKIDSIEATDAKDIIKILKKFFDE